MTYLIDMQAFDLTFKNLGATIVGTPFLPNDFAKAWHTPP